MTPPPAPQHIRKIKYKPPGGCCAIWGTYKVHDFISNKAKLNNKTQGVILDEILNEYQKVQSCSRPAPATALEQNPSKKRRDVWIWTTCHGCKLKKLCNSLEPYLPNCGRDYDEELALEHDACIRADMLKEVLRIAYAETMQDGIHTGWLLYDSFRQELESLRQPKEREQETQSKYDETENYQALEYARGNRDPDEERES